MKKNRLLCALTALLLMAGLLSGCQPESQPPKPNMVDERFELVALIFRLAGHPEYGETGTEYQRELSSHFGAFKEHEAVQYAASLPLGYDAVFKFAVHLHKDGEGFTLLEDIGSLVQDGRWTGQSAAQLLKQLNDFYSDTDFAAFYAAHMEFYEQETQGFIDRTYADIDLEWFGDYVDTGNLHCVYAPNSSQNNYAATVNDTLVYCAVSGFGAAIVHEYCHSFGNPLADRWYAENAEFKKLCDDSLDPVTLPYYANGEIMAREYVTRAYNTLYHVEHDGALATLVAAEKREGFPYIETVYAMVLGHEGK